MKKIALVGNPNAGKTCLFNELTGLNHHVANYPGITVEYAIGKSTFSEGEVEIVDLPGTYSLTAYSPEEIVTRDFILKQKPDLLINVVDASNLERNLYLTTQLISLNVPFVIALNMVDTARLRGIVVDHKRLSEILGVKVIPTVAKKGEGIEELKKACSETVERKILPRKLAFQHELTEAILMIETELQKLHFSKDDPPLRWFALKLLEDDPIVLESILNKQGSENILQIHKKAKEFLEKHSGDDSRTAVVEAYYAVATGAARECIKMSEEKRRILSDQIDEIVCNRFLGPIILFAVVYFLFAFVFKLSDEWKWLPSPSGNFVSPTELLETAFESLANFAKAKISNDLIRSLITDGIISGVGGVLSFVPLIFFMFLFIAAIEDSGYMARVAFILDKVLRIFGLQGKSILPLLLTGGIGGGGCAVPGIMATRTMREEKDRLVTILVTPMMNCGAKMPVYAMLIAAFFSEHKSSMMFLLWALSWVFTLSAALFLRKFVIKGEQTPFVMELPVYHMPTLKGILMHSLQRTWLYVKKAGTIILLINVALWLAMTFPRSGEGEQALRNSLAGRIGTILEPVSRFAGFEWRENIALIGGFAAKEVVVSTLATAYSLEDITPEDSTPLSVRLASDPNWNPLRAFVLIVFVMLYAPCIPTVITIKKETQTWKWAIFSTAYSTIFAFIIAVLIYQIGLISIQH